jgi:putative salt-induced outer membrane protein YdiY
MLTRRIVLTFALIAGSSVIARADEVLFKNGDRITGKVLSVAEGKMTLDSKLAGTIKVDMADVKTFSTDAPIAVRTKDGQRLTAPATAGDAGTIKLTPPAAAAHATGAPQRTVPFDDLKYVNFSEAWTGSVVAGAMFTRGNSYTDQANVALDLTRRTEQDRWIFGAAYNFGRQRSGGAGDTFTSTDNWFASGEYDYFLNPKLFVFASLRYDHDRIANLDHRLTPSVGVGYQWLDAPDLKFATEAGIAYVVEHFDDDTSNDHLAAKLAYHLRKKFNESVELFHNLEYYPSLERVDDYLVITDAGVRATLTQKMFAEYKLEFRYDSTPAADASRSDLRHMVGVGWKF